MNFLRFQRPSRYINNEINAIHKDEGKHLVRLALAFPDVYEVGMSHLGLRILYHIVNALPWAACERVFHPWGDMEAEMRLRGVPICSLEDKRPLGDFDVVGFSLQHELSYTSVLNMLSLGGIPLERAEREASSKPYPLIIAGGPSAVNPAPVAPFIDAFLIGDGEEAVVEIMEAARGWKTSGDGKRASLLRALSGIEGVYVPSLHNEKTRVRRRIIASLEEAPYPDAPVVPYAQIVHDRVNIEVSRGCSMGCRFCQAGMIYRPLRERSPGRVLELAQKALQSTGHDEVSFTSLSAGDYSGLLPLLKEFNRRFAKNMVGISLPSLRVKAINGEILREIKSVRKSGFTIAPEAATERLRAVINKDFSEEEYENALHMLFKEGWLNIKLYFMIGLPTERQEDVEAIPGMALKALQAAKRYTGRFVNVSAGVSFFVPKPHTPFGWCGQEDMDGLLQKKEFLREVFRKKRINLRGHDEKMSLLEAAFSRGDEKLSRLLLAAVRHGARLDGWGEVFDFDKWLRAMDDTGIDIRSYAAKSFRPDEPLPWDMIDTGIEKSYLLEEYEKAILPEKTPGCGVQCAGCGLECGDEKPPPPEKSPAGVWGLPMAPEKAPAPEKALATSEKAPPAISFRLRVEFSRGHPLEALSHRELITLVTRAARRAGLPLEHTKGFHPAPKIAFGPPLGVGVKGMAEYFDAVFTRHVPPQGLVEALNAQMPEGLRIKNAVPVAARADSLQGFISEYVYEIIGVMPSEAAEFMEKREFFISRDDKEVDLRRMVMSAEAIDSNAVRLTLRDAGEAKVRLDEAVTAMFGTPSSELRITRVSMRGRRDERWLSPLEAITGELPKTGTGFLQ